jgi:hypothetical protein
MCNPYKARVGCPIIYCDYITRTHIALTINEICVTPMKLEWNAILGIVTHNSNTYRINNK